MNKILDLHNLTVSQGERHVIESLDMTLYASKVNVLIGESGAGKSILIKALLGALPEHFDMTYDEWHYHGQSVTSLKPYLGKQVGYISQDYTHSFNDHTPIGKQLIGIYRQHYKVSRQEAVHQVQKALQWVGRIRPSRFAQTVSLHAVRRATRTRPDCERHDVRTDTYYRGRTYCCIRCCNWSPNHDVAAPSC